MNLIVDLIVNLIVTRLVDYTGSGISGKSDRKGGRALHRKNGFDRNQAG